ncbi:MAG: zinc ribbon domain-containing protein [Haloarculaceae archaeon]
MAESSLVECPVCEAEFDPRAAGGWCTNSECGEWQYDGPDLTLDDDDTDEAEPDDGDDEPTEDEVEPTPAIRKVEPEEPAAVGEAGADDADAPEDDDTGLPDTDTTDEQEDDGETDAVETGEKAGEASTDGADAAAQSAAEPVETTEEEPRNEDGETAKEPVEIECPGCGETLAADTNFCPSCGEDVSAVEPESADDDAEELTECPSCSADVGPEDSFCASCGEDLEAHRGPDELTACPSCDADIDPEDSFCVSCGEDLDAHRGGTAATDESDGAGSPADGTSESTSEATAATGTAPESLVLAVRGEEITVSDGDTVGRELRRIVTESGGDEDAAVRIHREHVRFVREDGQFYLIDLGRNPTRVNDTRMEQDDREPVGPGDEVSLSGVVTLAVQAP